MRMTWFFVDTAGGPDMRLRAIPVVIALGLLPALLAACSDDDPSYVTRDECERAVDDPGCCRTDSDPTRYYLADDDGECGDGRRVGFG